MPPKVSVVIPVWNPGPNLPRCLGSLVAQTMPPSDYEIVCVDDGSTDGTADRLDEFAQRHHRMVRVIHTPNSGWPGVPRNIGIDAARGTYVHLVDNDDTLPPYALRALHSAAVASDADVVLGRPSSDFRGLNHSLYRADIVGGTLADHPELAETLTPHKMFRRELLQRHSIRFPEGPVPLEDQFFVLDAYLRARSITMLTDRPYYSYLRRVGSGRNAGDRAVDPVALCRSVDELLAMIEARTEDPVLRDHLFRRAYRVVLAPRLSGRSFLDGGQLAQRTVLDAVRTVVTTRLGDRIHRESGAVHRILYRLVVDGELPGVVAFAERCSRVGLRTSVLASHWQGGVLRLRIDAMLLWHGEPMRCEAAGSGWALPAFLAPAAPAGDREIGTGADPPDVELSLVDRATGLSYGITEGLRVRVDGTGVVRAEGAVTIDPARAAAGGPLADGVWDLRLRLRFEGWHLTSEVRVPHDYLAPPLLAGSGGTVSPRRSNRHGALALDVGQWIATVADRVAPSAMLAPRGPAGLELTIRADVVDGAAPWVELLLEPESTASGLLLLSGSLRRHGHAGRALLPVPDPVPDGRWRVWLRLGGLPAASPTPLRWLVRGGGGRLAVERSSPTGAPGPH